MNLLARCALRSPQSCETLAFLTMLPFLIAGCGGASKPGATLTGNTAVTVLATSTANDQLVQFPVTMGSLTLTDAKGNTVQLLPSAVGVEYLHLNGTLEPLGTVTIPQGTYASASATFGSGYSSPVCVGIDPSTGDLLTDGALNGASSNTLTVNLPAPITITGAAMGLILNLDVAKSAPLNGPCSQDLSNNVPVNPTFDLTPLQIASRPTNSGNGKALNIEGEIASVNGNAVTVNGAYGYNLSNPPTWQVTLNSNTSLLGVSNASKLAAGMAVDMDLALQGDGSLLATRLSIYDTSTTNLAISSGEATQVAASLPRVTALVAQWEGNGITDMVDVFNVQNTTFQISNALSNLADLPFPAQFNVSNLVPGQNVYLTTHASLPTSPFPTQLTTVTLMPQTINGTVNAISSDGAFTTYTVMLAPYNLFPNLAPQAGPGTVLHTPGAMVVYADNNTQMLNRGPITVGNTLRFNGLVFNDNGTLRMDCAQINDGVAE